MIRRSLSWCRNEQTSRRLAELAGVVGVGLFLQALWALGNICGSSTAARDEVLAGGAVQPVLANVQALMPHDGSKETLLHNACWMVSTVCRGKPTPPYDTVRALPLATWE